MDAVTHVDIIIFIILLVLLIIFSATVFSHAQTVVMCPSCSIKLCQPTGGKARLTEGCSFRRKAD